MARAWDYLQQRDIALCLEPQLVCLPANLKHSALPLGAQNYSWFQGWPWSSSRPRQGGMDNTGGQIASAQCTTLSELLVPAPAQVAFLGQDPYSGSAAPYVIGSSFCPLKEISPHPQLLAVSSPHTHSTLPRSPFPVLCAITKIPYECALLQKALTMQSSENDPWATETLSRHKDRWKCLGVYVFGVPVPDSCCYESHFPCLRERQNEG